nr:tol-Pal system protein TolA-like [Nicotiana tomentosiformis]
MPNALGVTWRKAGVTKDVVLRPPSSKEGTKSPVPKPGKDKKRKAASWSEDTKPKIRRVKRKAIALSMDSAISKFRADHSQCEVELQKVSGERDALRLLYGLKDEKKTIDRLDAEKKTILAKLLSADVQLRNVKQKGSAQAKRIGEIEARLAEAKAEVESSKVMTDKSIAVYRADAEAAQTEARSAADAADTRAHWGGYDDEGEPGGEETALDDNPEA